MRSRLILVLIFLSLIVILFTHLWIPILIFLCLFTPIYFWERKQYHARNEVYREQLKEKYRIYDASLVQIIDIINQLLLLQKHGLTPNEKRQKKQLIDDLDQLLCESSAKGYVYFVKEYGNKTVKIGKAINPYARILKGFGVKIPYQLELLYLLRSENPILTEGLFHEYFKMKRINGEWFDLQSEDLDWIRAGDYPIQFYQSIEESVEIG